MTSISNQSDLENWSGGDTGTLTANITLSGGTWPLTLADNSILDGNRYTITLSSSNTGGLFNIASGSITATIKNLKIDADAVSTMDIRVGVLVKDVVQSSTTLTITNCGIVGAFSLNNDGGSFVGRTLPAASSSVVTISKCYSTATISGTSSGGIMGLKAGNASTVNISECYTTGAISGTNAGGISGGSFGLNMSGTATIKNCYATGAVSGTEAGGIVGKAAGSGDTAVVIGNCYHSGTVSSGGSITGSNLYGSVTINNSYSKNATTTGSGSGEFYRSSTSGTPTITNCAAGSGTWDASLGTDLLDDYNSNSDVWISASGFSAGYGLTVFNASPWDVDTSYTASTSNAVFAAIVATSGIIIKNNGSVIVKGTGRTIVK
jgi:hypothetical protein